MTGVPGEHLTFERFNIEAFLDPAVRGIDTYEPNVIASYLHAREYDMQLCNGGALLPGEAVYNFEDDEAYDERWERLLRIRQRIEKDEEFTARALLGKAALRQIPGFSTESLPLEELAERQAKAVDSVIDDINNGYQVGVFPFTVDTRPVNAGSFTLLHYDSGMDVMVATMRMGDFIGGSSTDSEESVKRRVERSKAAFNGLWEASITDRKLAVAYLGGIATDLRNIRPGLRME